MHTVVGFSVCGVNTSLSIEAMTKYVQWHCADAQVHTSQNFNVPTPTHTQFKSDIAFRPFSLGNDDGIHNLNERLLRFQQYIDTTRAIL